MTSVVQLLNEVVQAGGTVVLRQDGRPVAIGVPPPLVEQLHTFREEVIALLAQKTSSFPHCPRCCSYALYRPSTTDLYECETCNLAGIDETTARRVN